jgi:predicted RNase H-like nuclease
MDGCRAGWLYVALDVGTRECRVGILPSIDSLLLFRPAPDVVAMDIPMGLTDFGPRLCEHEARKILGRPRSSSVFPTPIRPVLDAPSYARACSVGFRIDGRKVSCQTWGITPKIREVDDFLRAHRSYRERIHEAHPEVSFHTWNGCRTLPGKKTEQGRAARRKLVASRYDEIRDVARLNLPRGGWAWDDLLDAFGVLWTAERVAAGTAIGLPADAPKDRFGLRMRIVY